MDPLLASGPQLLEKGTVFANFKGEVNIPYEVYQSVHIDVQVI